MSSCLPAVAEAAVARAKPHLMQRPAVAEAAVAA
jgi:hypothetical protein